MKERGILLFVLVVFTFFISLYFDAEISKAISLIRNGFFDEIFVGITFVSSEIIIFFFLTSLFLWNENKRRWIFPLWITLGASVIISFLLKISVSRLRPFQQGIVSTLPLLESASYLIWNFSFPSFQSMLVFCAVPILSKEFPKFKWFWIYFAIFVAFSRVYFGVHFLSDVIAGGLIGYLIGIAIVKLETEKKFGEKIWKKIFRR